jgi:hypothetical protein
LTDVYAVHLLRPIASAAQGEAPIDAKRTARLIERVRTAGRQAEVDAFRDLAARELDVLAEVARGKPNAACVSDGVGRLLGGDELEEGRKGGNQADA